jgi:Mycothiol maleylpyruvate isomerase N-terminal domain
VDEASWYLEVMNFFEREAASIEAARVVPACPGWDVHDLVAHQVHHLSSARDGSFPVQDSVDAMVAVEVGNRQAARARQDQWTSEGVRARRDTPIAALIADWRRLAAQAPAAALSALFPDIAVHFFDLLGAVGSSAYRHHAFVVPALRFWSGFAEMRLQQAGRGPIRLEFLRHPQARTRSGPPMHPSSLPGLPSSCCVRPWGGAASAKPRTWGGMGPMVSRSRCSRSMDGAATISTSSHTDLEICASCIGFSTTLRPNSGRTCAPAR